MVGVDLCSCSPPLDAGEVAVSDAPQAELAAVLGILKNACTELAGVREQLQNVTLMGQKLENLAEGQQRMGESLQRLGDQHQETQFKFLEQASKHELKIQEIGLKISNYQDLVNKVNNMEQKMYAVAVLTLILGALFASLPAWLERYSPHKGAISLEAPMRRGK